MLPPPDTSSTASLFQVSLAKELPAEKAELGREHPGPGLIVMAAEGVSLPTLLGVFCLNSGTLPRAVASGGGLHPPHVLKWRK